jgi:hypothetical protein
MAAMPKLPVTDGDGKFSEMAIRPPAGRLDCEGVSDVYRVLG